MENEPKKDEYKSIRIDKVIVPLMRNIGFIGSAIMSIAYIATITVLVVGFETNIQLWNSVLFASVSALVGLVIMQMLKLQGITFARELPENKEILKEYYGSRIKDKKFHNIQHYWKKSVIQDILIRAISIGLFSIGIVYISIQGSGDYGLLLLGFVNLLMFASFGLLSLASAYDHYNEQHINYIRQQLAEQKEPKPDPIPVVEEKPKPVKKKTPNKKKKTVKKEASNGKQTTRNKPRATSNEQRTRHTDTRKNNNEQHEADSKAV